MATAIGTPISAATPTSSRVPTIAWATPTLCKALFRSRLEVLLGLGEQRQPVNLRYGLAATSADYEEHQADDDSRTGRHRRP